MESKHRNLKELEGKGHAKEILIPNLAACSITDLPPARYYTNAEQFAACRNDQQLLPYLRSDAL